MRSLRIAAVLVLLAAPLAGAQDKPALPAPDAEGWISMFNGKDLSGWDGDPNVWRVENGYISGKCESVKGNTFLIFAHPFADFTLELKCQLIKTGKFPNSGIQYRSVVKNPKTWSVGGYQADIGEGWWGTLYEEGGRGVLAKAPGEVAKSATDDWNTFVVKAEGTKVTQILNGKTAIEFDDKDEAKRRADGVIALQYHSPGGFEIRFKDVRIQPVKK
jgi:hypothetical protein